MKIPHPVAIIITVIFVAPIAWIFMGLWRDSVRKRKNGGE